MLEQTGQHQRDFNPQGLSVGSVIKVQRLPYIPTITPVLSHRGLSHNCRDILAFVSQAGPGNDCQPTGAFCEAHTKAEGEDTTD